MSRQVVGQLIDRWLNEPEFRNKLRKDPMGAVKSTGVRLEEEEWMALKQIDWNLPDEELKPRVSQGM